MSNPPFYDLPPLAEHVKHRFQRNPLLGGPPEKKEWLTTLGAELRRVELDTEEDTQQIRVVAERLARTNWYATTGLEIIPYINGTPAGTPRQLDVLWLDQALYVDQLPKAKLARRVPEEIGKAFGREDIKAALHYSFERSPEEVREYLEENFKLAPHSSIPEIVSEGTGADSTEEPVRWSPEPDAGTRDEAFLLNGVEDETHDGLAEDDRGGQIAAEESGGLDKPGVRPRPVPKPAKPSIIERFAKAQGFRKDSDERYFHQDGSWIRRAKGQRFPWERRTVTGDLVRYYWPKDHCLEREPLQLEADIWGLIDHSSGTYALILSDGDGGALEYTGARLRTMCDSGEVTLYPAVYRIVYNHDTPE